MEIKSQKKGETAKITIYGPINKIEDSLSVKAAIQELLQENHTTKITLVLEDAYVITSALLGYLVKVIQGEDADILIMVKNPQLYQLMEKLNLAKLLNVERG